MPNLQAPEQLQPVDLERESYISEAQVESAKALEVVVRTMEQYSAARRSIEARWMANDALYNGVVQKRYWPGTQKERASLAVMLIFDQIEAAYPMITEALFDHYPTFFDVEPQGGVKPAEAVKVRDAIADILDSPYDSSGLTALPHLQRAAHQFIKYGDGVVELNWTGDRFVVEHVDIREMYMDPKAGVLIDSKPVIRRQKVSVESLRQLRGQDGISIPSDEVLNHLSKKIYYEGGDVVKEKEAQNRKDTSGELINPDPRQQDVEVLKYVSKDKLIIVLGREWVMVNEPNPYGFINYCKAPFVVVDGNSYSMSAADALEQDQRYAQGIRNGRLDNLSLAMSPPRAQGQGTSTRESETAWHPGLVQRVSDPKEVVVHQVENYTADAYREEDIIHRNAAKRLGINELSQSGVPTPSNANRTAGGVGRQAAASSTRQRTAVKNFEDYLIVPMLYKLTLMIQKHAPEQLELPNGNVIDREEFARPMKWKMNAASRMIIRERLGGYLMPITQFVFNPDVVRQANMQGKTLDFGEWERFLQDATGRAKLYSFFRPMNEQEQAAMQQPDPQVMAQMQMKQQDAQVRLGIAQQKSQTELQKAQIQAKGQADVGAEKSAVELLKLLLEEMAQLRGDRASKSQMVLDTMMRKYDIDSRPAKTDSKP
jgi:hypothetical protein